jgi:outer membrane cobalamin receptor
MFNRKNGLSQNVSLGLALSLMFFFSIPSALPAAEEKAGGIDDISLGDILNLETFMVTATKRKISVRKAPAIATVITADEIRNMGARDLTDVLKTVPGFGVAISSEGYNQFEVRGISTTISEKILVMIDGHRVNTPYMGSGLILLFDNLSLEKVRQVEIIRGPGSALYGANAFVGVINVITKDADDVDGMDVTVAGGNFDTKKVSAVVGKSFKDNDLKIFGSVAYSDTDGDDVTIKADRIAGAPFSMTPGHADPYLEKKEAFMKVSYGDLMLKGHYLQQDKGVYIGIANALTDHNLYDPTIFWSELSYSKSFTDKFSASLRTYLDYFEHHAKLDVFPKGFPGYPDMAPTGEPSLKNRTLGTELQLNWNMFEGNHVVAGFDFEHIKQYDVKSLANFHPFTFAPLGSFQDVSSWGNFNRDVTRKVWAVYLQDEWAVLENLNLTAGVRYDNYDDFGGTTNPRVGLVWNFLKNADMKLLYGQAFRAPSFSELYNDGNPDVLGNPNCKPEKIKSYEIALGYRFGGSHTINANWFRNEIVDLIAKDTSTSPAIYTNRGSAKVDGVEVVIMGQYSPANYWKLNYTWQNPKDADTDEDLPNVPSQRAAFSVNYGVCKYLDAHADILWTGERPRVSGDDRGDMPSYTTVDLTLIAKNFYKGFEIRGIVHNLFDEEYEDPDLSGAQKLIPYDYPREGISALVEFSYRF